MPLPKSFLMDDWGKGCLNLLATDETQMKHGLSQARQAGIFVAPPDTNGQSSVRSDIVGNGVGICRPGRGWILFCFCAAKMKRRWRSAAPLSMERCREHFGGGVKISCINYKKIVMAFMLFKKERSDSGVYYSDAHQGYRLAGYIKRSGAPLMMTTSSRTCFIC
jgi:hypothetical protein